MTFSARFVFTVINYAIDRGADRRALLDAVGFSEELLLTQDFRVEASVYQRVLSCVLNENKDPLFGLHFGESMNSSVLGLLGQIVQTSTTIGEALKSVVAFTSLGCEALPSKIDDSGEVVMLSLCPNQLWRKSDQDIAKATIQATSVFIVRELKALVLSQFKPLKVVFDFDDEGNKAEYERIFECEIEFNASVNRIVLSHEFIQAPILTADPELLKILLLHAEAKTKELRGKGSFCRVVESTIVKLMGADFPGMHDVAAHLNVSVRTLQRKLRDESSSYSSIASIVQVEFAKLYILKSDSPMQEIAYLLGFSDGASFSNFFKRQVGVSPREFRETRLK